jgi:hypothetical protein
MACTKTTHDMREVGKHVIEQWFAAVVRPFIASHVAQLCHVLDTACAIITGLCALKMLLGGAMLPNDLNIMLGEGEMETVALFITETLGY